MLTSLPEALESRLKCEPLPIRLSGINLKGWPFILSLWTQLDGHQFVCATKSSAKVVEYLTANPKCGFEISSNTIPYWGIRGYGTAIIDAQQGKPVLEKLLQKYIGNLSSSFSQQLMSKAEDEVAIIVQPKQWFHWDFTNRMTDENLAD